MIVIVNTSSMNMSTNTNRSHPRPATVWMLWGILVAAAVVVLGLVIAGIATAIQTLHGHGHSANDVVGGAVMTLLFALPIALVLGLATGGLHAAVSAAVRRLPRTLAALAHALVAPGPLWATFAAGLASKSWWWVLFTTLPVLALMATGYRLSRLFDTTPRPKMQRPHAAPAPPQSFFGN
jgi:hypothetical protein